MINSLQRTDPASTGAWVAARADAAMAIGTGTSIAQHGELLQGQLEDGSFRKRRFLISLPCDRFRSTVTFMASPAAGLTVTPEHKEKVRRVAELTLDQFGLSHLGGSLHVHCDVPEGKGYGSSTSDCVAAALAVANAVGQPLAEEEVAAVVVAAEVASDNFMFTRAVLFAHREGVVLEELGPRLPRLEVLGVDTDPGGIVATLDHPPACYTWHEIQRCHTLVAAARRAVRSGDADLLGRVATASAKLNQQFLPKPMFAELCRLAECAGALGIAVAHSGTVLSLLFDPADASLESRIERAYAELDALGVDGILRFHT